MNAAEKILREYIKEARKLSTQIRKEYIPLEERYWRNIEADLFDAQVMLRSIDAKREEVAGGETTPATPLIGAPVCPGCSQLLSWCEPSGNVLPGVWFCKTEDCPIISVPDSKVRHTYDQ